MRGSAYALPRMDRAVPTPRFPHLDGVRAIAALSVLTSHTSGLTSFAPGNALFGPITARMNVGVTIFFVLSGFLLYRPFVAARLADRDGPRLGGYLRRRALRIIPAYWLALTVLAVWPGLNGVFTRDWWVYYGFAQNLKGDWIVQGIPPAWTLHVEMTFYAVLPLLALAAARGLRGRPPREQLRLELAGIGLLAFASLALRTWRFEVDPGGIGSHLLPELYLWFALGMALAVVSAHLGDRPRDQRPGWVRLVGDRPWVPWAAALVVLAASTRIGLPTTFFVTYDATRWFAEHVLYALIGVLVVLPAAIGTDGGGWVRALLAWRPLAWVGLVSYGVYLWHLPLAGEINARLGPIDELGFPIVTGAVLAASLVAAGLSYHLMERPLMRRFREPRGRTGPVVLDPAGSPR
jgi:peptidoglycan/LPS O-acetylase OafA/YrhL